MVGILFVTIISWIPGHAASYLGSTGDYSGRQLSGGRCCAYVVGSHFQFCRRHAHCFLVGQRHCMLGSAPFPQPSCSMGLRGDNQPKAQA